MLEIWQHCWCGFGAADHSAVSYGAAGVTIADADCDCVVLPGVELPTMVLVVLRLDTRLLHLVLTVVLLCVELSDVVL